MDIQKCTTEHHKGQHLLAEEHHEIEARLKGGWSVYRIVKHLSRDPITPSRMRSPEVQYICTTAKSLVTKRRPESSDIKKTAATTAIRISGWKFPILSIMWSIGLPRDGLWILSWVAIQSVMTYFILLVLCKF